MPIARTSAAHAALHAFAAWSVDGVGFGCRDMPPEQLGSPKMPATMRIQGVLYLEDTSANGGGIRIVPGFHHKFEEWVGSIHPRRRSRDELWRAANQPTLAPTPGAAGKNVSRFEPFHTKDDHFGKTGSGQT